MLARFLFFIYFIDQVAGHEKDCFITGASLENRTCFMRALNYAWNCSTGNITVFNPFTNTTVVRKITDTVLYDKWVDCTGGDTPSSATNTTFQAWFLGLATLFTFSSMAWLVYYYLKAPKQVAQINLRKRKREY